MKALIFDCDGVLVDTERDGHREAFNRAYDAKGLDAHWGVEFYGKLLKVAGGKERMRHYFETAGYPDGVTDKDGFLAEMHKLKTGLFMEIIETGRLPLRPGVARLIDEAIAESMTMAICTTSNERAVNMVADALLGPARKAKFSQILAGDVVSRKKPDPEIYTLAAERLGLAPSECVVIEDSRNGLLAAKAAGMHCVVTTSSYTTDEDFSEADAVFAELGEDPASGVTLGFLKTLA